MMPFRKSNRSLRRQAGFTLIEIAIALVIVGLLIGGIIRGQGMIRQAKIKKIETLTEEIRSAAAAYYRNTGRLPGDSNNDGWIETNQAFPEMVALGLITGTDSTTATTRKNPFGGDVKVEYVSAYKNNFIIFTNLQAYQAEIVDSIDAKYDDGVATTGTIRFVSGALYMPL